MSLKIAFSVSKIYDRYIYNLYRNINSSFCQRTVQFQDIMYVFIVSRRVEIIRAESFFKYNKIGKSV